MSSIENIICTIPIEMTEDVYFPQLEKLNTVVLSRSNPLRVDVILPQCWNFRQSGIKAVILNEKEAVIAVSYFNEQTRCGYLEIHDEDNYMAYKDYESTQ